MRKSSLEAARQFVVKAEHDLIAAEQLIQHGPFDVVCFHLHQAVEKYLKAFLQRKNVDFPRTHDLDALLDLCGELTDIFERFESRLKDLFPMPFSCDMRRT